MENALSLEERFFNEGESYRETPEQFQFGATSIEEELEFERILQTRRYRLKSFMAGTSASISFFTPLMTTVEVLAGLTPKEMLQTRLLGLSLQAAIGRPYARLREIIAERKGVNENSSKKEKLDVERTAGMILELSTYPLVLYSSIDSITTGVKALCGAIIAAYVLAPTYGKVNDWWRRKYGINPTLHKKK